MLLPDVSLAEPKKEDEKPCKGGQCDQLACDSSLNQMPYFFGFVRDPSEKTESSFKAKNDPAM